MERLVCKWSLATDERYNDGICSDICGMTKGPRRHKETWWWNEEVAEAVREKKIKNGKWKKENAKEARMEYKKSRKKCKEGYLFSRRKETEVMCK